ncbi:MAG: pyridoxamine 5'-phosphate oxidase family protein, partial [Deltaproteobacteria bacterium]|nr:pyridoxamine 5'-phosphate oxidase family protein [Candidatus Desulfacyla euxinica]
LRTLAKNLIEGQSTMTLATAQKNAAWAAPVYYVFFKSSFYFFSDPGSRHIEESLAGCLASAAIHSDAYSWKEIRGVQMSGSIDMVSRKLEVVETIGKYLKKFDFTQDFFSKDQALDMDAFAKRFHVRLYKFKPSIIYYLDNSIRFGFREAVDI